MTYQEISRMIDGIGFPAAYYQFSDATAKPPPFICFYYPSDDDLMADDRNYQKISSLTVELYTDVKDFEAEERVEAALRAAGLSWGKSESNIDSEQMHMTVYEMEVMING